MSHFAVLVITNQEPTDDHLHEVLLPYHEFECTGENNQYVIDVDQTAEARQEYDEYKVTRYRDPDGNDHDPYQDRFYRDPTEEEKKEIGPLGGTGWGGGIFYSSKDWGDGLGYRSKVHFLPEGWTEVQLEASALESFAEWAADYYGRKIVKPGEAIDIEDGDKHKWGHILVDEKGEVVKVIDRTNPNRKWDWYQRGGRWMGRLLVKSPDNTYIGSAGLGGKPDGLLDVTVDSCQMSNLDLPAMRARAAKRAGERWDKVHGVIAGREVKSFDTIRDEMGAVDGKTPEGVDAREFWDKVRTAYWAQLVLEDLKKSEEDIRDIVIFGDLDELLMPREQYIKAAENNALCMFAVLKDGQWYEKGQMGWWATVSNSKGDEAWGEEFAKLLDGLPPEAWITVVDCHI